MWRSRTSNSGKTRCAGVEDNAFYIDATRGLRITYAQLQREVAELEDLPTVVAFEDCYGLFKTLLATMVRNATLVLVDRKEDHVEAVAWMAELAAQAPYPRPLSPEYRGDGELNGVCEVNRLLNSSACRVGLFTSGTTGKAKLVFHTLHSLTRAIRVGEAHRQAVWGLAYHPAHFAGLQVFFQALANRNTIVRLFGLDTEQMHGAIEEQAISHLSATPTMLRLLVSDGRVHASVQRVALGGERADADLLSKLKRTFPQAKFRNIYASTEVGSVLASDGELFRVPERYHHLIKIVDGELAVHRSLLADSLRAACIDDFYLTGDCVEVVEIEPLAFRFMSRRSDFINVGGYKVDPQEVEELLNGMPEVHEAAVYGKANSVTGNLVCCDLVLREGKQLSVREVITRLSSSLPNYKIPRMVRVVPRLAVTPTGKRVRPS